jgi:hypothetical protein
MQFAMRPLGIRSIHAKDIDRDFEDHLGSKHDW